MTVIYDEVELISAAIALAKEMGITLDRRQVYGGLWVVPVISHLLGKISGLEDKIKDLQEDCRISVQRNKPIGG